MVSTFSQNNTSLLTIAFISKKESIICFSFNHHHYNHDYYYYYCIYTEFAITGFYVGGFIAKLHTDYKADLKKIEVTAHSLGAQVAGCVGKAIKNMTYSKIGRITALDPAKPLFELIDLSDEGKLTKADAELVVVVHTAGGVFGYLHSSGHIDFFPNGGIPSQPGCAIIDLAQMSEYN